LNPAPRCRAGTRDVPYFGRVLIIASRLFLRHFNCSNAARAPPLRNNYARRVYTARSCNYVTFERSFSRVDNLPSVKECSFLVRAREIPQPDAIVSQTCHASLNDEITAAMFAQDQRFQVETRAKGATPLKGRRRACVCVRDQDAVAAPEHALGLTTIVSRIFYRLEFSRKHSLFRFACSLSLSRAAFLFPFIFIENPTFLKRPSTFKPDTESSGASSVFTLLSREKDTTDAIEERVSRF